VLAPGLHVLVAGLMATLRPESLLKVCTKDLLVFEHNDVSFPLLLHHILLKNSRFKAVIRHFCDLATTVSGECIGLLFVLEHLRLNADLPLFFLILLVDYLIEQVSHLLLPTLLTLPPGRVRLLAVDCLHDR
jgi:hypothetical protein